MPELPPPLPPGERTVGQLIAETIRAYGDSFWRALPLGLPIAVLDQLDLGRGGGVRIVLFVACAPLLAFAFAYACALAGKVRPERAARLLAATAIGTLVLLPGLARLHLVRADRGRLPRPSWAWPFRPPCSREPACARRCGARCSSAAPTACTRSARSRRSSSSSSSRARCSSRCSTGQADETIRVAVFLADIVLAPLMLLGAALLYFDQAARVGIDRKRRGRAADAGVER